MKQEILHSLENFPAATSPQYKENLSKLVENFKVREAPEIKASELVNRANEAKIGVHFGSKEYDNAVTAMEDVQKSLEECEAKKFLDFRLWRGVGGR